MANEMTTIQISKEDSERLKALATIYKRSKRAQMEWIIQQEFKKLALVHLKKKEGKQDSSAPKAG